MASDVPKFGVVRSTLNSENSGLQIYSLNKSAMDCRILLKLILWFITGTRTVAPERI